ncbi:MAG: hypothetical protein KC543_00310 [Myxococcales bacterium]|nr:hypothetical protein [Myxococcales bacterium]
MTKRKPAEERYAYWIEGAFRAESINTGQGYPHATRREALDGAIEEIRWDLAEYVGQQPLKVRIGRLERLRFEDFAPRSPGVIEQMELYLEDRLAPNEFELFERPWPEGAADDLDARLDEVYAKWAAKWNIDTGVDDAVDIETHLVAVLDTGIAIIDPHAIVAEPGDGEHPLFQVEARPSPSVPS